MLSRNNFKSGLVLSLLVVMLLSGPVLGAHASFSGSWENDLSLLPQSQSMISLNSSLKLSYTQNEMAFSSVSKFERNDFTGQRFTGKLSAGLVGLKSNLAFDTSSGSQLDISYWRTNTDFTLGGVNVGSAFVLEQMNDTSGYGSGLRFSLSGELGSGPRIYLDNYFGMEENEAEALGLVDGSGYTIVTQGGDYGPSELQYVETRLEVTGLEFDCCSFHSTAKLSEEKGFEYALFEFEMEAENFPLELDSDLRFTPQTKSVKLRPRLDLNWACLDVYAGLRTADDKNLLVSGQNSTVDALAIEGFGLITDISYGGVRLSFLKALDGNLFRVRGEGNIGLRADEYVIDPPPDFSNLYARTDYDGAVSLGTSGEDSPLTLAADTYFDSGSGNGLFDFGLFTGSGKYRFADGFTLGAGVSIKPDEVETVRLSLDYEF